MTKFILGFIKIFSYHFQINFKFDLDQIFIKFVLYEKLEKSFSKQKPLFVITRKAIVGTENLVHIRYMSSFQQEKTPI